jgi:hypothetical protein
MTKWAFLAAAALTLGGWTTQAQAGPRHAAAIVDGWYHQYLGRCADPCGLRVHAKQLQCGKSPDVVLSGILGSEEYYQRHGCCQAGFIKGLYKDHLGRCPSPGEVRQWLCVMERCATRDQLALKFLCASKRELAWR